MSDVLIIGAGPAGLSAAIACAGQGLRVTVLDEFMRPGGRLLGQLHEEPDGTWWNGIEEARRLVAQAEQVGVELVCGVSVYDLQAGEKGWSVSTTRGIMEVPVLLLATGAAETAVPLPGWTLPGVMSIGAAQVMANVHRVRPGERCVIIGVNILSVAIARELQLAGVQVERMVLPPLHPVTREAGNPTAVLQSLLRVAHLAPASWIRWGSKLAGQHGWMQRLAVRFYPRSGVRMWEIPIQLRTAALEIGGTTQVESVRLAAITPEGHPIPGTEQELEADFVCIAGGLQPLVELAAVAGCPFAYIPSLGGHVPMHNERMETPLAGLYVAGNITGIESAKVAMAQGTVAGLAIAERMGRLPQKELLEQALAHVEHIRRTATIQFHPEIAQGRAEMARMYQEKTVIQG